MGDVRVGIAVSDAAGHVASPVGVLPTPEVVGVGRAFKRILDDYEPEVLVCGRPRTLSGEDGPQAERVVAQARLISAVCGIPLEFVDERLTSQEAKRILRQEGLSERQMRGKVDMIAASIFLQAWLDVRCSRRDATRG